MDFLVLVGCFVFVGLLSYALVWCEEENKKIGAEK